MIECETVTRKWGNSIGVTLPKEVVESAHLGNHQKIKILILKQNMTLKKSFGFLKGAWRKKAQETKDEVRKELYHG